MYKEMYLSKQETAGLHSEQLALIDFLVLVQSRAFVGIGTRSYSMFLREYRHVMGVAGRDTAHLVSGAAVGTDALFDSSANLL
jgi:hypothetical protein